MKIFKIILIVLTLLVTSCVASKETIKNTTDTVYINKIKIEYKHIKDSSNIYQKDTMYIKGDTVIVDRLKRIYIEKLVHDTVKKIDTVYVYKEKDIKEIIVKKSFLTILLENWYWLAIIGFIGYQFLKYFKILK